LDLKNRAQEVKTMTGKLGLGVYILLLLILMVQPATGQGPLTAADWQAVDGPYGGSVAALAISPAYTVDHTAFAGFRGQGVYQTDDGGLSWQATDSVGWVVVDLALSPAYAGDQTLFALTGFSFAGFTLYHSTDDGQSWQASTTPTTVPAASKVIVSPQFASDQSLYLLTANSTPPYYSTDGGVTLTSTNWFSGQIVTELAFSPDYAVDQTLFALVKDDGVYRSTNGGANWDPTGLTGNIRALAISPNFTNDQTLLIVDSTGQLQRSTNSGSSATPLPQSLSAAGDLTLRFSPSYASDQLILAASSLDPGP
jgi:photosystem II stability/assembly factor-like uncharacterized protein